MEGVREENKERKELCMSADRRRTQRVSAHACRCALCVRARNQPNFQTFPHFYDRRASLPVSQRVCRKMVDRKSQTDGVENFGDFWESFYRSIHKSCQHIASYMLNCMVHTCGR